MLITIDLPEGPRHGAEPDGGIRDEFTLVRSLLVTLAAERIVGHGRVTLTIDLENADPGALVNIARKLKELKTLDCDTGAPPGGPAGDCAVVHDLAEAWVASRKP